MYLSSVEHQHVYFSIYLLFTVFVTVNCEMFNISAYDERIDDLNQILQVLRGFQLVGDTETMQFIEHNDINETNQEVLIDTACKRQIDSYDAGINNMETWALEMLDASSKIPSGIFRGNVKDIGMFDECVSVKVMKENMTIVGRHCMYTLSVIIPQSPITIQPTLSLCLPAACGPEDVNYFLQSKIDSTKRYINYINLTVISVSCSNIDADPWDTGAIVTITVIGLLICLLTICTICDCLVKVNVLDKTNNTFLSALCEFSFYTNSKRIFSTSIPCGTLPAIAGLKFFSMCWIILGHTYSQKILGVVLNLADLIPWVSTWSALAILIAPFAVDTFFVISGALVSYIFLKKIKDCHDFNPIIYYLHRYIRLTPALGALLLLTIFILPRIGSGALWRINMGIQKNLCSKHWWNLMFYIQNYGNFEVMACLDHTWYLAVDMQLFWISPFILYPLAKKPRVGMFIFVIFVIASIITPTVITLKNKYSGGIFNVKSLAQIVDVLSNYYTQTYIRAAPWLMGVYVGYKLSSTTNSPSTNFIRLGWILTALAFAFVIFTYRIFQNENYEFNVYWEGFYAGFSQYIWSIAICWIIYASALGCGGFISSFLSAPMFIPISRISYSIYLVHFSIQAMKMGTARTPEYFSNFQMISIFCSDIVMSIVAGFIFSLLFESPFLVLEKMFLVIMKKNNNSMKLTK